jgi:hypothetical protein
VGVVMQFIANRSNTVERGEKTWDGLMTPAFLKCFYEYSEADENYK